MQSWKVWHMEDDTTRPKESVSLAAVANMGDELEEGQPLGSDLNHAEDRNNLNEAGQEPFSERRTLQAALRVKRFYREHAQLFRWICIGLLCTGEPGPTHSSHLHPSHPCLRAGSFTYPVSQQSFVEQQLRAEHARSRASRIKADQMLFPRPDVDQLGRGQQLCPHSAACHLGAPRKDGGDQGGLPRGGGI